MRRRLALAVAGMVLAVGAAGAAGCVQGRQGEPVDWDGEEVAVYTREDGSGTRSTFVELFGVEKVDESGATVDLIDLDAAIVNSTAVMTTTVAGDPASIGYVSLGTLDGDGVKAVAVDGVEPTVQNVENGSYRAMRPFNLVLDGDAGDAARDFVSFIMSDEGQRIVADNEYLPALDNAGPYASMADEGEVVVAGSSSAYPLMEKVAEAYADINPGVKVVVQLNDSSTGAAMVATGTCDVAMLSRDLTEDERARGLTSLRMGWDGIAVVVNEESPVDDLSSEQVREIFAGALETWGEVLDD